MHCQQPSPSSSSTRSPCFFFFRRIYHNNNRSSVGRLLRELLLCASRCSAVRYRWTCRAVSAFLNLSACQFVRFIAIVAHLVQWLCTDAVGIFPFCYCCFLLLHSQKVGNQGKVKNGMTFPEISSSLAYQWRMNLKVHSADCNKPQTEFVLLRRAALIGVDEWFWLQWLQWWRRKCHFIWHRNYM